MTESKDLEPKTWEDFDKEYARRKKAIREMGESIERAYDEMQTWAGQTSNRLREEIGPR